MVLRQKSSMARALLLVLFMGFAMKCAQATLPLIKDTDPHIVMVFDPTRTGDAMQLRGIADSLKRHIVISSTEEIPIERKEQWIKRIASVQDTVIVLTINREGIDLVETLRQNRPKHPQTLLLVHASHQMLKDHPRLAGKADVIALPRHAVTLGQVIRLFPSRVVLTRGLAHALSAPMVIKALRESKDSVIPERMRYLTVILGGDADLPDGDVLFYRADEAVKLARYAAQKAQEIGAHLLILNGPRTGRYDPDFLGKKDAKKERPGVHRDGCLDPVTEQFMVSLKALGVRPDQVNLYDFQWGQSDPYLLALSATMTHPGSHVLLPGESTSRVSESVDVLPPGVMTVYYNGAMHETHKQHITSEWREGRFDTLTPDMNLNKAPQSREKKNIIPAADAIARAIVSVLNIPAALIGSDYQ